MILVKEKTVYIQLNEILKNGDLVITNITGNTVLHEKITSSHYEVIWLDQPAGKYWIKIDSERIKTSKSFHIK
jgi:hypothetical protein